MFEGRLLTVLQEKIFQFPGIEKYLNIKLAKA